MKLLDKILIFLRLKEKAFQGRSPEEFERQIGDVLKTLGSPAKDEEEAKHA